MATRQLKFFEDLFIHFDRIRECDAQTNGRADTALQHRSRSLMHSIARQKSFWRISSDKNSENLIVVARGQQYDELHDVVIHITDC